MTAGEDEGPAAPDGGVARTGSVAAVEGETGKEGPAGKEGPTGEEGPAGEQSETGAHAGGVATPVSRREALAYAAGTGAGLGGWKALDNVVLGYGVLGGTNLLEQDLAAYASERFAPRETAIDAGGHEVRVDGDGVSVFEGDGRLARLAFGSVTAADARALDQELGLPGAPVSQIVADAAAIAADEIRFEFSTIEPFFERLRAADPRPYTVAALRGPTFDGPEAGFVAEFAEVHPSDPADLVEGLVDGFRAYSSYDVPRYLAGSIEDNVLLGAADLRQYFESPTSFEALAAGENTGLFCTELVVRSIEAFHAVPATEQSPPVVAGYVQDSRHKHAYTALASAIRVDGDLVVPATFVDYTHSTLYDDLHLRWLLGEGVEAYNDRHRTSGIYWNTNAGL